MAEIIACVFALLYLLSEWRGRERKKLISALEAKVEAEKESMVFWQKKALGEWPGYGGVK